ncbi:secretion protein [Brumimicrobium salinarum]|uniref:Secretion protein n=1 Tax=Brumimicrobium salinarum TaxID=2058658 RepID=A0A2I0R404_9FLAO|nr:T9SS type A sorting domain-containing protein [Brumimicrobium salinarum]PKR81306.1 secretion protein [Brumimicrobium salinarum]
MNKILLILSCFVSFSLAAQSYPPAANESGTDAIHVDSSILIAWATGVEATRGYLNMGDPTFEINGSNLASAGSSENAIGEADNSIVSLGDGGSAILTFDQPIKNGPGADFAVFENSFSHTFLELALVEVSSDGEHFVRFPAHSETQTSTQVGGFGTLDPAYLHNLAGKYKGNYGTPFDLEDLKDSSELDIDAITHVKIIDVIGAIDENGSLDAFGNKINDPYPTPFESCGFDLSGIGVIHQNNNADISKEELGFKIYPNPSDGKVSIDLGGFGTSTLIITNSTGKIIKQTHINQSVNNIDITLNKGVYFLRLINKTKSEHQRLIVR